jgi:hypothetical protein
MEIYMGENEEVVEKSISWVPSSALSFADYDDHCAAIEEMEHVYDLTSVLQNLISNVLWSAEVKDKSAAINGLVSDYQKRISTPDMGHKEISPGTPPVESPTEEIKPANNNQMLFVKEASGRLRWFAIYSNNYRDDDGTPEIISEKSHKCFTYLVKEKLVPYPELWHWHIPGTRWGEADYVDYHEGLAYASGLVDEGHEKEAEVLQTMDVLVSHGMPKWSIVRNPDDSSVIDFHVTKEISPLPAAKAANKLTGFVLKEIEMALAKEKKDHLKALGYDETGVTKIENLMTSKQAEAEGRESKEADVAQGGETKTDTPTTPVEVSVATSALTAAEVAEAVGAVLSPLMVEFQALKAEVATAQKEISDMKAKETQKDAQVISATPALSLKELMSQHVFGKVEAQVDGRSALAKDKPVEKAATPEQRTGIAFIDAIMAANKIQVAQ